MKNHFVARVLLLIVLCTGLASYLTRAEAADLISSNSIAHLASLGTNSYTFTDTNSGASVMIMVTMKPYSSDPGDVLTILDGATRCAVGNPTNGGDGNWIDTGEGVTFTASLVSASANVNTNSVQFGILGVGIRQGSTIGWTSSVATLRFSSLGGEAINSLDQLTSPLAGTVYSGRLTVAGQIQLSDVVSNSAGLLLHATFSTIQVVAGTEVGGVTNDAAPSLSFINSNSVLFAANFGGSDLVRDGISFTGVAVNGNPTITQFGNCSLSISAPSGSLQSATYGDPLFGAFIWGSDQNEMTVVVNGLSNTKSYKLYYLAGDDRTMNFDMSMTFTGLNGTESVSTASTMTWGASSANGNDYIYFPLYVTNAATVSAQMDRLPGSSGVGMSGIIVVNGNNAPTLTTIATLLNGHEDTPFTISYSTLTGVSDASDLDGDTISFRIESLTTGTLTKNGTNVVPGSTLISAGDSVTWTPATNANGTLNAFSVRAYDGNDLSSSAVQVKVNVTAVNDSPVLANPIPNQSAAVGVPFSYTFAADTFTDVDSATLTYGMYGSEAYTYPTWLTFDAATRTFSGTPTASGTFGILLQAYDGNSAAQQDFVINVAGPLAPPTITLSSSNFCVSVPYTATGPSGMTGYAWSITNGGLFGDTHSQTLNFTAGSAGTTTVTLVVTNSFGQTATNSASATVYSPPGAAIFAAAACANSSGNTASAPSGMASYAWSISNGTITSATNVQTITYTAGSSGVVGLTLVIMNAGGCGSGDYTEVPISPYPTAVITASSNINANSTGNTASATSGASSYSWSISNGTITSATNTQTVTYTAGASGLTTLNVLVGNSAGCFASSSADVVIITPIAPADPRTNSWMTNSSGRYARIYKNKTDQLNGVSSVTWSNGLGQTLPAYAGIQEVYSSSNWVYARASGLGTHVMGPWYFDAQKTQIFAPWPTNQKILFRIPRNPTVSTNKTVTSTGSIGYFVDGVAMYDDEDSFFWNGTTETNVGTGYWFRDAFTNEGLSFDPNNAHQQQNGIHHYHANPPALRFLLNDNVLFNSSAKTYSENTTNNNLKHSPILGWMRDGFPLYGPYGYSTATNTNSAIRRMISGFVLRNGQNGTDNLSNTGRTGIPAWAARVYNTTTNHTGPTVSGQYFLGRYLEDYAYLGDLGYQQGVQFDLDEYNGRFCVTPEFPNGTYAYFCSIESNGTPKMPYNIGRAYYGVPNGNSVSTISELVVTNFLGGTNLPSSLAKPNLQNSTVTLTWSALEGGTYKVEASTNLTSWSTLTTTVVGGINGGAYTNASPIDKRFYRESRVGVASFDSTGTTLFSTASVAPGGSASRGTTVTVTITLPTNPPQPPGTSVPASVTLGSISGTGISRPTTGTVESTFVIPANAITGSQNIVVTFSPAPVYTLTNSFTINP